MVVAANISEHRARLGLSLGRLAAAAGLSLSALKHLSRCRSDPPVAMLLRLADALGITLKELTERVTPADGRRESPRLRYPEPDEIAKAIGPRVRVLRLGMGLSTRRLAELAEISTGMLHYIEAQTAVPTTKMLARLAAVFDSTFSGFLESLTSPVLAIAHGGSISDGAISLSESRLPSGGHIDVIESASAVMLYVLEGELRLQFARQEQGLSTGDAVLLAGGRYTITAGDQGPARFLRVTHK
jgi:transcriptional regulator with XRE-family HTH domain